MNKPRKHRSAITERILQSRDQNEAQKTRKRLLLAARIEDAIKSKGWNKLEFAEKMGKNPSEITRWLSGTHNFTSDTLMDIEAVLRVQLLVVEESLPIQNVQHITCKVIVSRTTTSGIEGYYRENQKEHSYKAHIAGNELFKSTGYVDFLN